MSVSRPFFYFKWMVTFSIFSASALQSQTIERPLRWSDFNGTPDASSRFTAYTYWTWKYEYDKPMFEGDRARIKLRSWCELDPRSWVKEAGMKKDFSQRLLKHEQGHYDICRIYSRRFRKEIEAADLGRSTYREEIRQMFQQLHSEAITLEKKYDRKTEHMGNLEKQKAWDAWLAAELKKYR